MKEGVRTFVSGGRAGTLGHGEDSVGNVLLLDGHGRDGAVGGGRETGRVVGTLSALLAGAAALRGCGHGSVEGGELLHHALVLVLLVGVDGLGMLAEVVEAGELLAAVAGEGALAGVFPSGRR